MESNEQGKKNITVAPTKETYTHSYLTQILSTDYNENLVYLLQIYHKEEFFFQKVFSI